MTDHDALCPQRHQYRGHKSRCVCALLAAARADEQEKRDAYWRSGIAGGSAFLIALKERDAARAEVAVLRERWADEYDRAQNGWGNDLILDGSPTTKHREVLADLRAKVRLIPAFAVRMEHEWDNAAARWVPTDKGVIDTVPLSEVLALIEEVQPDSDRDPARGFSPEVIRREALDAMRIRIEALFRDCLPPYVFRDNEHVLFPGMETTMTNEAVREVWRSARDQVLDLFKESS